MSLFITNYSMHLRCLDDDRLWRGATVFDTVFSQEKSVIKESPVLQLGPRRGREAGRSVCTQMKAVMLRGDDSSSLKDLEALFACFL